MFEPLVQTIEVPCDQQTAFTVFLELDSWWPKGRFATSVMRGEVVREVRVEARDGGAIVEVCSDGEEYRWGTIRTYDPYGYLKMDFHVPHPGEASPGFSTVEVRFVPLADDRTRVELEQSDWESLGDVAEMAQSGYRTAWTAILADYRTACEDRAAV